jgi:hypothetical protein
MGCILFFRGMELKVMGLENRNYTLTILNLLENIDESKSHWKVKTGLFLFLFTEQL